MKYNNNVDVKGSVRPCQNDNITTFRTVPGILTQNTRVIRIVDGGIAYILCRIGECQLKFIA